MTTIKNYKKHQAQKRRKLINDLMNETYKNLPNLDNVVSQYLSRKDKERKENGERQSYH